MSFDDVNCSLFFFEYIVTALDSVIGWRSGFNINASLSTSRNFFSIYVIMLGGYHIAIVCVLIYILICIFIYVHISHYIRLLLQSIKLSCFTDCFALLLAHINIAILCCTRSAMCGDGGDGKSFMRPVHCFTVEVNLQWWFRWGWIWGKELSFFFVGEGRDIICMRVLNTIFICTFVRYWSAAV